MRLLFLPFAMLYGMVMWLRNLLFDTGVLRSRKFSVPVISAGNLRIGGTGKTPHVEYLVRMLRDKYRIAVLSRGYKRKTKGFVMAGEGVSTRDIGDEPMQIHTKFPDICVAVHEKRIKGIKQILEQNPDVNLIILDDAFQHRYVKPGLNLLLTGYYNPFFRDFLLPVGYLREAKKSARRADALIVTKTPLVFSPLDRRFFLKKLKPYYDGPVFFSTFRYQELQPLYPEYSMELPSRVKSIFLVTGIANTVALEEYLKRICDDLHVFSFPDHHRFSLQDLKKVYGKFSRTIGGNKIIVTTEKDAMRLQRPKLKQFLAELPVFFIPIEVSFHGEDKKAFEDMVKRFLSRGRVT
ncbi:MAG: tetraacyldisaccharide 4'-kinase [Bacteroidales bacterium]|nr:tetraacyldisaccharide 4'-kinase [Bacteroidales bacterium]